MDFMYANIAVKNIFFALISLDYIFVYGKYNIGILKRQTPQDLVDEVETIYEDFSHEEIEERKQSLLIMNERNVFFPEDDEDE